MVKKPTKGQTKPDKTALSGDLSGQTKRTRELATKKKLIDTVLLELSRVKEGPKVTMLGEFKDIGMPMTVQWFRHRRYLVRVLYGLSIQELKEWKLIHSLLLMDDLGTQEKRGIEAQVAAAEAKGAITAVQALGAAAPKKKALNPLAFTPREPCSPIHGPHVPPVMLGGSQETLHRKARKVNGHAELG